MSTRQKLELAFLAAAVALSRFLFRSRDLYDIDSVNFGLALRRFDPRTYQPHPPGYFLYICIGRLLNFLVHDANLALVLLSILASIGVVIFVYLLALDWFGSHSPLGSAPALFAGLIFLFSPLFWFHGIVALTYSVEAFFSALLGYLCWKMKHRGSAFTAFTGITLGISAGVRPSSLLFLGPLFLFALLSVSPKKRLLGLAALGLTLLAWFIPMLLAAGGPTAYFGALISLWSLVPSRDTVFNSSPATSIARAFTEAFIYLLCFGAAAVLPLLKLTKQSSPTIPPKNSQATRKKIFTAVWITPALCFFTLIFLKLVNSGYLLLLMPPVSLWMGLWLAEWFAAPSRFKPLKTAIIAAGIAANIYIFLAVPLYCSYASVRHFETELNDVTTSLPQVGPPQTTLIIGVDNHFLGYRHAGYYLPAYLTLEYPEVKLTEGTRIFAMHNDDTRLLTGLPQGFTRFVLCPLPNGDPAYQQFMAKVKNLLPPGDLTTTRIGRHDFVSAPIADLPLLFPQTAVAPRESVNAAFHPQPNRVNTRIQPPQ